MFCWSIPLKLRTISREKTVTNNNSSMWQILLSTIFYPFGSKPKFWQEIEPQFYIISQAPEL